MASRTSLLLLLLGIPLLTSGGNVLLMPCPALSHVMTMANVGGPLVNRGHKVYAVMNANCHKGNEILLDAKVELLLYPHRDNSCVTETPPQEVRDTMADMVMRKQHVLSLFTISQYQSHLLASEGQALYSDPTLIDRVRNLNIDVVIVDGTALSMYYYILPYKLDLPYISLMEFYHTQWAGVPDLPSISPVMMGTNSDKMTFLQRVDNTVKYFTTPFLCTLFQGSRDSLVREYAPEKPDSYTMTMFQLQRRSKLWLMCVDHLMDYPRPALPHVIYVGGLSTGTANSLPPSLAHIANSAHSGLVIVSFGSILSGLPKSVTDELLEAFRQFSNITIIWKYNGPMIENLPDHIHTLPWLPQNDLLGHPNTKAFVTHSGVNGQFEALYHGVPMVAVPVFGDQPYNAARMQAKGYGLALGLSELTAESLLDTLKKVVYDPKYRTNIKRASEVYRSRVQSPQERAVHWVEHVINYGADHLLSSGLDMPWYQYWMLDVFLFISAAFIFVSLGVYHVGRWCSQWCLPYSAKIKIS